MVKGLKSMKGGLYPEEILLIIMVVCLILIVVGIPLTIVLVHKYKNDHFEDYISKKNI